MAMLLIENNEEWKKIGGRILIPVHDEIIAEVPIQNYEKGAELLSSLMCQAADFLPFTSKCDVEISHRWYGLSYPCPYPKPTSIDSESLTEDEIKWVQYHLVELEYLLPVIYSDDGEAPRGDAAHGINGKITPEYTDAIQQYIHNNRIKPEDFINHIDRIVTFGV